MKKTTLAILMALFISALGFAQGHETFDNFSVSGNGYNNGSFIGEGGIEWTYTQARGDVEASVTSGDQGLMLGRNRNPHSSLESASISNGIGTLKFSYMQAFGNNVELEVYVNDDLVYTATTNGEQGVAKTTSEIQVNVNGDFVLKFLNPNDGRGQVNIDDIIWTAIGNDPALNITSPANTSEISPFDDVVLNFNVANFDISTNATAADGDGYVQYKTNNDAFVDYFSTDPVTLTNLAAGQNSITVQLVDNAGDVLNPEVTKTVTFTVLEVNDVNSIADLRDGDINSYYNLTSEAILTFQQNFRNQKYIQDATAAILIDDQPGVITTSYNQYDGITGITGRLTINNGLLQLSPIENPAAATSEDNFIMPEIINYEDYVANPIAYESQLVAFENLHFVDADGTITFATGSNYTVSNGTTEMIMRTNFFDADYIGDVIPQGTQAVMAGIASHFHGDAQIFMRDTRDLNGTILGVEDFTENKISIYPNPATDQLYINISGTAQVEVYSILGNKVIQQNLSEGTALSLHNLKAGVYMVKISQDGYTTTKKLIKK